MTGSLPWPFFGLCLYLEVSKFCSTEFLSRAWHCFNKLPCLEGEYVSNNSNVTGMTEEEQLAQFWSFFAALSPHGGWR